MKLIAPSILSADFARLGEEIKAVEAAGADWIHIDVMDGHFVPNITIGPLVVEAVRPITRLPLDVHLMIENPEAYIMDFIKAGADIITVQAESTVHVNRALQMIKEAGKQAGVVLNPHTPLSCLDWVLEQCDLVMLMSVNPGFGGQKYIENCTEKTRELKALITEKGLDVKIEIDGGIKTENIASVSAAGADVFVAGSAVFGSDDYARTITTLKNLAENG